MHVLTVQPHHHSGNRSLHPAVCGHHRHHRLLLHVFMLLPVSAPPPRPVFLSSSTDSNGQLPCGPHVRCLRQADWTTPWVSSGASLSPWYSPGSIPAIPTSRSWVRSSSPASILPTPVPRDVTEPRTAGGLRWMERLKRREEERDRLWKKALFLLHDLLCCLPASSVCEIKDESTQLRYLRFLRQSSRWSLCSLFRTILALIVTHSWY
ncbi:hypothetical protein GJAV_G00182300 [Gymnothorax javanicus]|nr:hypothetical protein GJAV_G00182300 [Gymnothorax javanicus]